MSPRGGGTSRDAFTIIETIIAAGLTILIVGALFALVRGTTRALAKASSTTKGERLLTDGIAAFKSMNYYRVFPMDSSQPNFGINGTINGNTTHPDSQVLSNLQASVAGLGYSKFTLDVVYLHRDSTDSNGNGQFELIPFQDNGVPVGSTAADKIDDWDSRLRYTDQNSDSDYFDTYLDPTGRIVSEAPNTDIKNVTLNLWKGNNIVLSHSFLLTNGLYTGENPAAADASLTLVISTPPPSGIAYRYTNIPKNSAPTKPNTYVMRPAMRRWTDTPPSGSFNPYAPTVPARSATLGVGWASGAAPPAAPFAPARNRGVPWSGSGWQRVSVSLQLVAPQSSAQLSWQTSCVQAV
jgi:type II secretory pathway pseudopilin PulG